MYSKKEKLHIRERNHKIGQLRTISLDVTSKCNMSCAHCYAEPYLNIEPAKLGVLKKVVDELYDIGVFHYVLQGGEPIADKERLEAILKIIHPDETFINVVSNGWEMTRENILWLKKLKVDKIALSLDSGIEKEHDYGRRYGSFKRVLDAVDIIIGEKLDVSIATVVTNKSLYSEGFLKAFNLAKSKGIRIDIQIAEPVGKWDGRTDLLIKQEDAKYIKKLELTSPLTNNGRKMVKRDIYCDGTDHCPAGKEFMAIASNGDILPCNFLQYSLGNISNISITEARNNLLKNAWFNKMYPYCILGENEEFIKKYVTPYINLSKPLDAYKIFNLKEN